MKHSLIIGASIVLGCLILGLQHSTPVVGQQPPVPHGRFQMMAVSVGPSDCQVVVTDSNTGESWTCHNLHLKNTPWMSLGTPGK